MEERAVHLHRALARFPGDTVSILALLSCLLLPAGTHAQPVPPFAGTQFPSVALTANASTHIDNDRMTIVLQAESERPQASMAAAEVNAKMAKALAIARAASAVKADTVSYGTNQVPDERGKMAGWRVSQVLRLETADFAVGANLATKLQDEGLLLTALTFNVSPDKRRKAVAKLQHEALTEWQAQAKQAATSMGYSGYTPGRLSVNAVDAPQPQYANRAMLSLSASLVGPVAVSSGSSDVVVMVSGDAILSNGRK